MTKRGDLKNMRPTESTMLLKSEITTVFLPFRWLSQKWHSSHLSKTLIEIETFFQQNYFLFQLALILLYRLSLDLLYIHVISPVYAYAGFLVNFQAAPYIFTLLTLSIFTPFIIQLQGKNTPSSDIVTILNYIYFIPLTSYCGCYYQGLSFFLIGMVYWAALLIFQFWIPTITLKSLSKNYSRGIYFLFTILCTLLILYVSGRYTGFRLTLDLSSVYDIREEASGYALPGIINYALSIAGSVLAILLLYWLHRHKYVMCITLSILYLFLFSIAGHKSLFFFLLLVLLCYFLFHSWMRRWLPALMVPFSLLAILEYFLTKGFFLAGYLFRRVMYVPVALSKNYMDYFQDNPLCFFRGGVLRHFSFSDIYSDNVSFIIGAATGEPGCNACNGLLGDMFSNLPVLLGLLLLPLILVICFRLLDATALQLPEKLVFSSCIYFAVSFSNTSWSTVLLTHGFLVTCFLLYIFPKEEDFSQ